MQLNILQLYLNGLMNFFTYLELLTFANELNHSLGMLLNPLFMSCILHFSNFFKTWIYKSLRSLTCIF